MSDLISRQAVLKIINKVIIRYDELKPKYELIIIKSAMEKMADEIVKDLEKLPSVEPERKPGKWIDKGVIGNTEAHDFMCSECGWHEPDFPERIIELHYCANCGVKMEVQDETS